MIKTVLSVFNMASNHIMRHSFCTVTNFQSLVLIYQRTLFIQLFAKQLYVTSVEHLMVLWELIIDANAQLWLMFFANGF